MKIVSEMTDGSPYVTLSLYGKENSRKTITFNQYLAFLSDIEDSSQSYFSLPTRSELPRGYYGATCSKVDSTTFTCYITLEAGRFATCLYGKSYVVPFPALFFEFSVIKGRLADARVFALDIDKPTDSSVLYQYPFGNVNTSGNICWGGNSKPPIKCLKDVERLVSLFVNTDSNDDYYSVGTHVKAWNKKSQANSRVGDLFAYIGKKEEFPKKLLVSKNKKIEDIIKTI